MIHPLYLHLSTKILLIELRVGIRNSRQKTCTDSGAACSPIPFRRRERIHKIHESNPASLPGQDPQRPLRNRSSSQILPHEAAALHGVLYARFIGHVPRLALRQSVRRGHLSPRLDLPQCNNPSGTNHARFWLWDGAFNQLAQEVSVIIHTITSCSSSPATACHLP